jgi:NAD(P)-dependent dehydrogenase (short-subunit alcohol dehydrogenase family)
MFHSFYQMNGSKLLLPAILFMVAYYTPTFLADFDVPFKLIFHSFPLFAVTVPLVMPNLTGKVAIVTGGNSGIGLETVRALAEAGCKVVMTSRDIPRGQAARVGIKGEVFVKQLDLASMHSVENFVKEFITMNLGRLDFLVLNAGKLNLVIDKTDDGLEWMVGSHHIGHFYLTDLLMPILQKTISLHNEARVVVTSSSAMVAAPPSPVEWAQFENPDKLQAMSMMTAYGASKLANQLFAVELRNRHGREGLCFLLTLTIVSAGESTPLMELN